MHLCRPTLLVFVDVPFLGTSSERFHYDFTITEYESDNLSNFEAVKRCCHVCIAIPVKRSCYKLERDGYFNEIRCRRNNTICKCSMSFSFLIYGLFPHNHCLTRKLFGNYVVVVSRQFLVGLKVLCNIFHCVETFLFEVPIVNGMETQ